MPHCTHYALLKNKIEPLKFFDLQTFLGLQLMA